MLVSAKIIALMLEGGIRSLGPLARVSVLAVGAIIASPLSSSAQALDCENALTQREMNACAEQEWMDADQALNAVWPQVKKRAQELDADLPKAERGIWQATLDAQRAWITYRDKNCEAEGGPMRGGSAEPLLIYGCRLRLTEERVKTLRYLLEADEY